MGFILSTVLFEAFYTSLKIYCSVCTNTCKSVLPKFNQNQEVLANIGSTVTHLESVFSVLFRSYHIQIHITKLMDTTLPFFIANMPKIY